MIMFLWASLEGLTVTGCPVESKATREQVASKPIPLIFRRESRSVRTAETSWKFVVE